MASVDPDKKDDPVVIQEGSVHALEATLEPEQNYKLYKRRFVGLGGMVILSAVSAMGWPWFGPISNNAANDFSISLNQVAWLGNIVAIIYLPIALSIPMIVSKFGFRRCCDLGTVMLLLSGWVRYAATADSLSGGGAYALLFLGQVLTAIAQPVFQVLGPKYSELWFNLNGRTTATMVMAISNPIGGAIGQLLSPLVGSTKQSILVLAIISTAAVPFTFLIGSAPPSPPTYASSHDTGSLRTLLQAWAGKEPTDSPYYMTGRERVDFSIIFLLFGVLAGMTNTFAVLSNQYLEPAGYSADLSGLMGAALLFSGVLAACITAPLFDRVLTHHLALTTKFLVPTVSLAWLSLIWAVRPNVTGALFAVMVVIGITSVTTLPVALELACEVTCNADASSALLWFSCNLAAVIFILVDGALRGSEAANPPYSMKRALTFNGVCCVVFAILVFFLKGRQRRREIDEENQREGHDVESIPSPSMT